jgi:uncharacterized pyridoxal phosphate-containing UPF0001 family protein
MQNIQIKGVMGMASFIEDLNKVRDEFATLRKYFDILKSTYFPHDPAFCEMSMGMTHDRLVAIEEGSTMIRIGTAIFGERK